MAQQVHSPVAGDGLGELAFVGGFDEFVDEFGGQCVADPETVLGCRGTQPDEQVRFAGAGVTNQNTTARLLDPFAAGQGVDGGRVDRRVGVVIEVSEPLFAGKSRWWLWSCSDD